MKDSEQIPKRLGGPAVAEVRKQERSFLTRQQLMEAARTIFVRDGFERARLQDIAALAGKTRGAFYAQFKDKEDVFFAIFEQNIARDQQELSQRLLRTSSKEKRIQAVASYLVSIIQDDQRMLLMLEFKMYVLRHPNDQKRLADLHIAVCEAGAGSELDVLLPELALQKGSLGRRRLVAQFGAILDGLALNRLFDPNSLDKEVLLQQVLAGVRVSMK